MQVNRYIVYETEVLERQRRRVLDKSFQVTGTGLTSYPAHLTGLNRPDQLSAERRPDLFLDSMLL